jgi:predicted DNA-binding ribbon-helix-helix protein
MKSKHPPGPPLRSRVTKRSTLVDGRKTSVTLEDEFWNALKEIAATQNVGTPKLISMIDRQRQNNNLSSSIRVFSATIADAVMQKPKHPPGQAMTFGNMRQLGVQRLTISEEIFT